MNLKQCLTAFLSFVSVLSFAQKQTTLAAQIKGYQQEMVYFDCVQSPFINAEFHTNPSDVQHYSFKTLQPVCMLVNGYTKVLLAPGDSIFTNITYEGKRPVNVVFSGTDKAVVANTLYQNIEEIRRELRYKNQLLACVVVDVKPQQRINDSKILLERTQALLKKEQQRISPSLSDYISALTEAMVYVSFMEYPKMYEETRHLDIAKQDIGNYWDLMNNVKLRSSEGALACPEYIGMLMRYCFYANEKAAVKANKKYEMPKLLEDMYKQLAAFYAGNQRDAVLYNLLINYIRNGKEVERVLPLVEKYKKDYNINKDYLKIIDQLLQ